VVAAGDPLVAMGAVGVAFALLVAFGVRLASVEERAEGAVVPLRASADGEERGDARAG
jgi:hypothetical protein